MPRTLASHDVPALAAGAALLGAGGGGATTVLELMLRGAPHPPRPVHAVGELDPSTPCLAVAVMGSTMLFTERLPSLDPFAAPVAALERWLGTPVPAVCWAEIGGMNGLTPLALPPRRRLVDADLMGRALPDLDQFSLLVDDVPGVVFAGTTGAGVVVLDGSRPADVEKILRTATTTAGGWAGIVVGGFTVGDLARHALVGSVSRALDAGRGFLAARHGDPRELARAIGGELVGEARVLGTAPLAGDARVTSVDLVAPDGPVYRLVTRTEHLALVRDGQVVVSAPTVLVVVDAVTREVVPVGGLRRGRGVLLYAVPAPAWWHEPRRHARASPSAYGLQGLDLPAPAAPVPADRPEAP
ncbi:DUF917 family protein [Puerhibacterium sp. TATVAM-FAB25]|uniref:S-methyl thiohydantoin desulfurase domain-containing protein n=1 Tax=Puerhibacterium sp. TATVAM-FAB25 TaxID=3093699 RepID=UPI0039792DF7